MFKRISLLLLTILVCFSCSAFALKVGDMLPDLNLKDLEGNDVKVSDFSGEFVIYNVWAMESEACRKVLKAYTQNIDIFNTAEIKIVTIAVDEEIDSIENYVEKNNLPITVLHEDRGEDGKNRPTEEIWQVRRYPVSFLVGPEGKILLMDIGFSDFGDLWDRINRLLRLNEVVKLDYPEFKAGTYEAKPVNVDYETISEDLTLGFLHYDVKQFGYSPVVELAKEPKYSNTPMYGTIYVGEQFFTMVGVASKKSDMMDKLYVDFNQNLDLTDDGEPLPLLKINDYSKVMFTIKAKMSEDFTLPYIVTVMSYNGRNMFYKHTKLGYQAQIETDTEPINVLVMDATANGKFDDMMDVLLMDLDRNGIYDSFSSYVEWTRLSYRLHLGELMYRIKVKEGGKEILIEKLTNII